MRYVEKYSLRALHFYSIIIKKVSEQGFIEQGIIKKSRNCNGALAPRKTPLREAVFYCPLCVDEKFILVWSTFALCTIKLARQEKKEGIESRWSDFNQLGFKLIESSKQLRIYHFERVLTEIPI